MLDYKKGGPKKGILLSGILLCLTCLSCLMSSFQMWMSWGEADAAIKRKTSSAKFMAYLHVASFPILKSNPLSGLELKFLVSETFHPSPPKKILGHASH